ncbi:MAG: hypothetical protein IGR80_04720 [Synechococcales cyanobacterium K44_A2020_017]|nr:hypothetical protein [Synechococcales cyanobacterium K32_A2020_035]MBF2094042.1 hypothetical protein [Synechococcales cyanobacterium K44_A2020_017]
MGRSPTDARRLPRYPMSSSVDRFIQLALSSLHRTVTEAVQQWFDHHPLMAWLLGHPWVSVALLGITVILLWGLLGAIARLAQYAWISALRLPIWLGWWIILRLGRFLQSQWITSVARQQLDADSPQQRLTDIAQRLDALRTEQDALLTEVRSLLDQLPPMPNLPPSNDKSSD